jgi:hypothetical protein
MPNHTRNAKAAAPRDDRTSAESVSLRRLIEVATAAVGQVRSTWAAADENPYSATVQKRIQLTAEALYSQWRATKKPPTRLEKIAAVTETLSRQLDQARAAADEARPEFEAGVAQAKQLGIRPLVDGAVEIHNELEALRESLSASTVRVDRIKHVVSQMRGPSHR